MTPAVKTYARMGLVILGVLLIGIQLVPVQRTNPPVTQEVAWDSPGTRALAERACFDCHSNMSVWPWYSYVAPVSWRVSDHVQEGRGHLNFSEWDKPNEDLDEVVEKIEEGEMPLSDYLLLHNEARLTPQEKQSLISGFKRTFAADPPIERERRRRTPAPAD